jgi:hypothetical protein
MKVDLYTKAVLTVIAGCLVWICATQSNLLPAASAQATGLPAPATSAPQIVYIGGYYDVAGGRATLTPLPLPTFTAPARR